jgi:hypothetical protein
MMRATGGGGLAGAPLLTPALPERWTAVRELLASRGLLLDVAQEHLGNFIWSADGFTKLAERLVPGSIPAASTMRPRGARAASIARATLETS